MKNKIVIGLMVVLGLFIAVNIALADGPGWQGRGGWGYCAGPGQGFGPGWDDESAKIRENMFQKRLELRELMSAKDVDEAKVKAVQSEINKLRGELSERRVQAQLEFKKRNPDWNPGYGRGPGYGGGGCWR